VQTINALHKQAKDEREQAEQALVREADIRKRLSAVTAYADSLTHRLRLAMSKPPEAPAGSSESKGTPGTGSGVSEAGIDAAVSNVIGACKRDSIKASEWQRWYEAIPAELK
jgi:hypothetical protein